MENSTHPILTEKEFNALAYAELARAGIKEPEPVPYSCSPEELDRFCLANSDYAKKATKALEGLLNRRFAGVNKVSRGEATGDTGMALLYQLQQLIVED